MNELIFFGSIILIILYAYFLNMDSFNAYIKKLLKEGKEKEDTETTIDSEAVIKQLDETLNALLNENRSEFNNLLYKVHVRLDAYRQNLIGITALEKDYEEPKTVMYKLLEKYNEKDQVEFLSKSYSTLYWKKQMADREFKLFIDYFKGHKNKDKIKKEDPAVIITNINRNKDFDELFTAIEKYAYKEISDINNDDTNVFSFE